MKIDLTPEQIQQVLQMMTASGQASQHVHCWHPWSGPISMVLPNGHVLMNCCGCGMSETRHSAHAQAWNYISAGGEVAHG